MQHDLRGVKMANPNSLGLRDYQQRGKERLREAFRKGAKRVLFVSPTGSGKTVQAVDIMQDIVDRGNRVLFVCDRDILVKQTARALGINEINHGVIKAGHSANKDECLQVASIQTLVNRDLPFADFIIFDEAHERLDQQLWIVNRYPKAYVVGLTATPVRNDGRSFKSVYQDIVVNTTPKELIAKGFLVKERVFAPARIDTSGVRVSRHTGDYVQEDLQKAVSDMRVIGDCVESWLKYAENKMTIVFCVSVAHAEKVYEAFSAKGIASSLVTGTVTESDRNKIITDFESGKVKVLINVEVYVKGADIPAIECVVDLAPTLSVARYIQKIGRAARPSPGKDFFLQLDHAANSLRHGFWSDDREYSLGDDRRTKEKEHIPSIKICPDCFHVMRSLVMQCESCDFVFEKSINSGIPKYIDGELAEVINEDINVIVDKDIIYFDSVKEGVANFALSESNELWQGEHLIKRDGDSYNMYGKRTTQSNYKEALIWLLQKNTGSKSRQYLIEKILEGKEKGYKPQWAFRAYKQKFKFYPKMS